MRTGLPQHSAAAFIAGNTAEVVAQRLREDVALVEEGQSCNWIALYLPASKTLEGVKIGGYLSPSPKLTHGIKKMLYESLVGRLKNYLHGRGIYGNEHQVHIAKTLLQAEQETPRQPSSEQLEATLRLLGDLVDNATLSPDMRLAEVITLLRLRSTQNDTTHSEGVKTQPNTKARTKIPAPPVLPCKRLCYICRRPMSVPHPIQPSMCTTCGAFNLASSQLSSPSKLTLPSSFIALVTGARINLGYHTTLRLLRCGARVVATTRYPRDALMRYATENDYSVWKDRLKILGADFRRAADVFSLVQSTRRCLRDWVGTERLHLLVNNAAQTLTDSVRKEEQAIAREAELMGIAYESDGLVQDYYIPRVRGGGPLVALGDVEGERGLIAGSTTDLLNAKTDATMISHGSEGRSSWVQSLAEIPYEDVISAHSVNTFVPLIMCREFLPLMGEKQNNTRDNENSRNTLQPEAYIINVSSREGIFEDSKRSIGKAGKHVHTNMSKAALNMITETEAASAWQSRRVSMNTVDPGYMSAAPEYEGSFDGQRPIGWEDGAGRVLWPVAVGLLEGKAIWGRFLKHYGAVDVDTGAGR